MQMLESVKPLSPGSRNVVRWSVVPADVSAPQLLKEDFGAYNKGRQPPQPVNSPADHCFKSSQLSFKPSGAASCELPKVIRPDEQLNRVRVTIVVEVGNFVAECSKAVGPHFWR
ncbi:hypothetical protein MTO96_036705 [Rhipicephalus appendiculatus]